MTIALYWLVIAAYTFFDLSFPYNVSKYPIDKTAMAKLDTGLFGKFRLWEDSSKLNHFALKKGYEKTYHVTYMNRGGTHPWMELDVEMSQVKTARFLNFRCICDSGCTCYMLLRILPDKDNSIIIAPVVDGALLEKMKDSEDVLAFLDQNFDNPDIYMDTLHFSRLAPDGLDGFRR